MESLNAFWTVAGAPMLGFMFILAVMYLLEPMRKQTAILVQKDAHVAAADGFWQRLWMNLYGWKTRIGVIVGALYVGLQAVAMNVSTSQTQIDGIVHAFPWASFFTPDKASMIMSTILGAIAFMSQLGSFFAAQQTPPKG